MLTAGLYTLGCKVAQYETAAIGEALEKSGFEIRPFTEACDAYVINTCTVTAESDRKSRSVIRRARKTNPAATIAVVGCYSQRAPEEVAGKTGADIVLGTDNKLSVVGLIRERPKNKGNTYISVTELDTAEFEPMCIKKAPRTRAYVKIEDGCECKCTYCAIAGARGRVRSKKPSDVIAEVEGLYKSGTKEVVLTGIETGSYGKDLDYKYSLADLLCELDKRGSCERIRLGSLAPELCGKEFCERVKDLKILTPHFHISMQSGSDNVLRSMKRRYTKARAIENIERLRAAIPGVQFTTDIMVGFPGETDEDFEQTLDFIKRARLLFGHVFAYSKREGTPAALYENQVPEPIKRQRSAKAIELVQNVRDEVLDEVVKSERTLLCVLETKKGGYFTAHSEEYIEVSVYAPENKQGDLVKVRPVSHKNGIVAGELI